MRQATKRGVKKFSVISSIGAVLDDRNDKLLYTCDGTIPPHGLVSTGTDFIPLNRLESGYERTDPRRNFCPIEYPCRLEDSRRACGLEICRQAQ